MARTILVVAAHPDDEVLGCGATLARHAAAGDRVYVVTLADGVGARGADAGALARRREAATAAARALGCEAPVCLDFPDNRLDGVVLLELVKAVEAEVARVTPAIVYTHHGGDLNIDHALTSRAVLTACRPLPGSSVRALYGFETASSTEWSPATEAAFEPQRFVDVGGFLETKLEALACYREELREYPHPRSPEAVSALARWRGAQAGMVAAEAFTVLRQRLCEDDGL